MTGTLAARAAELTEGWPDEAKAELAARLRAVAARQRAVQTYRSPLDLASRIDRSYRHTPALQTLSARLVATANEHDGRLLVSFPPREGKTTLLRAFCTWWLTANPTQPLVYASYGERLARTSGRTVRSYVESFGAELGLSVSRAHSDAADWQLEGHNGGMLSAGVGSALTGFGAGCMVIDDAHKDRAEADSEILREKVWDWWTNVARTRLHRGAPVIVVGTRWHPDDLIGRLLADGWPLLNIPALADGKTDDALERPPGTFMESAQGRTPDDWARTKADVGERAWAALYQGRPAPLEGGVFQRAWFDMWRVPELPAGCNPPIVVVDPADNPGSGDEAGIVVGAAHPATGRGYLIDDLSAAMTVGRWARLAQLTCVRYGARTLAYEKSLSQLTTRIREAWQQVFQQATALHKAKGDLEVAVLRLSRPDDPSEVLERVTREVAELLDIYPQVIAFGASGPRVRSIQARGTKTDRMLGVAPAVETGRMCLVGRHPTLEHDAVTWMEGQDSPDRVDAFVYLTALTTAVSGVATLGRSQERLPTSSTQVTRGQARIGRSTRR